MDLHRGVLRVSLITALGVATGTAASPALAWKGDDCNVRYRVTDLGTLHGSYDAVGFGLNNKAEVVGDLRTKKAKNIAFIWTRQSGMEDLGTLGGTEGYLLATASAINNREQAVGQSEVPEGVGHAFIWTRAGGMRDLDPDDNNYKSAALGINDRGIILGYKTNLLTSAVSYFLWSAQGGMRDISGTLGGESAGASAINNAGQVVGRSQTATGEYHAAIWSPGGRISDLGTLSGGNSSSASDINSRGDIVGSSNVAVDGSPHAALWTKNGAKQDLGTLGGTYSFAGSINDREEVLGGSEASDQGTYTFLWSRQCGMRKLSDLIDPKAKFSYYSGNKINDHGQITGWASESGQGGSHAVLLSPVHETANAADDE